MAGIIEDNLAIFESTTNGQEMRSSLHAAFRELNYQITFAEARIWYLEDLLKNFSEKGSDNNA